MKCSIAPLAIGFGVLSAACDQDRAAPAASASAAAAAPTASASGAKHAVPLSASSEPSGLPSAAPSAVSARWTPREIAENAALEKLVLERGTWVAVLDHKPATRAWLTLATKAEPLSPRARAAYFVIAERVAPGIAAPTSLRAFRVAELAAAAEPSLQKKLTAEARVLGNGTVEGALTLAPSPALTRVEIVNLAEDRPAFAWESRLGSKEAVPEHEAPGLAAYQSLLAADYVAGNEIRVAVYRQDKTGRITAADGNEAFSPKPKDGALHDALSRLSRHMVFSKALDERLAKLERSELERALTSGDPKTLLVTPKQVEECIERARSIRRIIAERVKQRGAEHALVLP